MVSLVMERENHKEIVGQESYAIQMGVVRLSVQNQLSKVMQVMVQEIPKGIAKKMNTATQMVNVLENAPNHLTVKLEMATERHKAIAKLGSYV